MRRRGQSTVSEARREEGVFSAPEKAPGGPLVTSSDGYERVDRALQYRFGEHFEPYVRLESLFDRDYEEVNGFGSPGARAFVGLAVRR